MHLLVIGGSGLVGRELVAQALAAGDRVSATACAAGPGDPSVDWHRLDVRERAGVASLVAEVDPDAVVSTAYRVDDWATTADGAAHVALAVGSRPLVHVSSDVVFSGAAVTYAEDALPDPVSPYGAAKAAAETAVRAIAPRAVVARTSLVLGGSPFEGFVRRLATGAATGALFTDEVRCPVHVADLAAALLELAREPRSGVAHLAGPDAVSRAELGRLLAVRDGLDPGLLPVRARTAADRPGPLDVRLDATRTAAALRTPLRGVRSLLAP
ncbi:dTDP-4-dehydrorhamnose reductase [Motilibacter rhizosphaerae]|uniref:dTDP-4-dehydrorhamnose reductase n=1 Tax=Motilibacter rhizosphaerae TaxID=598652 RepID=A0A4V2F4P7_9ACTN|nr:sugar nucleotide-binding protein [Motilibacter rhizosphaerae]RZS90059.1 dTDP-4-dehydrorhamnose reductase [Motilibacter rhizosphaerae]